MGLAIEGKNRITLELSFKHCLMVSPTGYGKSTRYVLNNLLREIPLESSLIITDPSSELYNHSAGWLSRSHRVKKLDFEKPSYSYSYNPLLNISSPLDIDKLARNLIHSNSKGSPADEFWRDKATELLTLLIHSLMHSSIALHHKCIGNIRVLLNEFGNNDKALLKFFQKTLEGHLIKEAIAFINLEPKLLDGTISTAKAALKLWNNQQICDLTLENTICFQEVRDKPTAIFICIPESEASFYQPLVNQFYTDVFKYLLQPPNTQQLNVFLFLDEFGNFHLNGFTQILTVARKRKISISALIQSISQLETQYGYTEAKTIMENFQTKIFAPGLDLHSSQYLEALMGKKTVVFRQPHGWFDWANFRSRQMIAQPLMTADEIRRSPHSVIISENKPPSLLKNMKPYFEDKTLYKRSKINSNVCFPIQPNFQMLRIDMDLD